MTTEQNRTEQYKDPPNPPPGGGPAPSEFLEAWNAAGLVHAQRLTPKRLKQLNARRADPDWCARWREALDRAKGLPFCRGHNDRGWRADIDWFLRPDTVTRILEGKYESRPNAGSKPPASTKTTDDMIRQQAERRARSEAEARAALESRRNAPRLSEGLANPPAPGP